MTAKRKTRGLLARLEAAEVREEARREEVRAQNLAILQRARAMLSPADRAALDDAQILTEEDPTPEHAALIARMEEECRALGLFGGPPVSHTAKEEAEAWEPVTADNDGSKPLTPPPAGRVASWCAYFELCALWCEEDAARSDLLALRAQADPNSTRRALAKLHAAGKIKRLGFASRGLLVWCLPEDVPGAQGHILPPDRLAHVGAVIGPRFAGSLARSMLSLLA